jgi:hypothetical protein
MSMSKIFTVNNEQSAVFALAAQNASVIVSGTPNLGVTVILLRQVGATFVPVGAVPVGESKYFAEVGTGTYKLQINSFNGGGEVRPLNVRADVIF